MPDEDPVRALLGGDPPTGGIDLDAVLRRTRRRRRPRVALVAAGAVLAGAVVVAPVAVLALGPQSGGSPTLAGAGSGAQSDALDGAAGSPAAGGGPALPACGAPVDLATDAPGGNARLELPSGALVAVADATTPLRVRVVLRDTGTRALTGVTAAAPRLALLRDGVVVASNDGAQIARAVTVDLAPGEQLAYDAAIVPAACPDPSDPTAPAVALPPGDYELIAGLVLSSGDGGTIVLTSTAVPVRIG